MRHRVVELVGNRAKLMWVSTFHSACVRILRTDIGRFGISRTFSIYDDTDAKRLMQLVLRDAEADPKRFPVRAVLNWVSNRKNELVDHETAAARAETDNEKVYADAYREYQRRLTTANALDFDDLIMTTVHLLQAFPELREQYRRRFRHVLVDEYQDTNHAQYALVRELCAALPVPEGVPAIEAPELMVVGDSDQSIYAFRGATIRNILDFEADFPGAETIVLEQNYRSTQTILNAANAVITRNSGRPEKRLWSDAGDGERIVGWVADTEHDEAQYVAEEIDALTDAGHAKPGDVAVFYRTNAQSRAFEEVFIRVGMPYRVVGGVRFYERREVRDAIAYLRAIANPTDDVSVRRILNVPRRGIGARAEAAIEALAAAERIAFGQALDRASEAPGLATRSRTQIEGFAALLAEHRAMMAAGQPADAILSSILEKSGYIAELSNSDDPQDATRLENLVELVSVAQEFVVAAHTVDLPADGGELAAGAPEPDDSLPAFLERIALVAAEDQNFPNHHGFDLDAISSALAARGKGGASRGASTISQQVAKNLFLWSGRSWLRKGVEAYYTFLIETLWPKRRILEVYANIAEFGDGIYGAQAAAQHFYGIPAARLDARQSAALAAVLPNPRRVEAPTPYQQRRRAWIERQAVQLGGPAWLAECCGIGESSR